MFNDYFIFNGLNFAGLKLNHHKLESGFKDNAVLELHLHWLFDLYQQGSTVQFWLRVNIFLFGYYFALVAIFAKIYAWYEKSGHFRSMVSFFTECWISLKTDESNYIQQKWILIFFRKPKPSIKSLTKRLVGSAQTQIVSCSSSNYEWF